MSTSDWIAVAALVVAATAAVFAGLTWWDGHKASKAATDSAGDSKRSADAAEAAVENSRRSADAAEAALVESRRSADAAEVSASAAERSAIAEENQFQLANQAQRTSAHRIDSQQRHNAALVTVRFRKPGGLTVLIKNSAPQAISNVRLDHVEDMQHPIYQWRVARASNPTPSSWDSLESGQEVPVSIEFQYGPHATSVASDSHPEALRATYSFTDAEGILWSRHWPDDPVRVDS